MKPMETHLSVLMVSFVCACVVQKSLGFEQNNDILIFSLLLLSKNKLMKRITKKINVSVLQVVLETTIFMTCLSFYLAMILILILEQSMKTSSQLAISI